MAEDMDIGGVKITLKSNNDKYGKEVHVIMKRNQKLKTTLRRFCKHASLNYHATRFVINGNARVVDEAAARPFSHDKTAKQLGLRDGDQIDALTDGSGA